MSVGGALGADIAGCCTMAGGVCWYTVDIARTPGCRGGRDTFEFAFVPVAGTLVTPELVTSVNCGTGSRLGALLRATMLGTEPTTASSRGGATRFAGCSSTSSPGLVRLRDAVGRLMEGFVAKGEMASAGCEYMGQALEGLKFGVDTSAMLGKGAAVGDEAGELKR